MGVLGAAEFINGLANQKRERQQQTGAVIGNIAGDVASGYGEAVAQKKIKDHLVTKFGADPAEAFRDGFLLTPTRR